MHLLTHQSSEQETTTVPMPDTPEPGADFDAVLRLQTELKNESPRGVVLVATAMLEEALRELLSGFLVPNPTSSDTLFDGPNSPFGSLSAKIDAAYRLSIVSDKFCRDLHIIRRIRNEVAHKPQGFSFEDQGTRERIAALSQSHGIYLRSPDWLAQQPSPLSLRDQFLEAASWMLFFLVAERERITPLTARCLEFGYEFSMDEPRGHTGEV